MNLQDVLDSLYQFTQDAVLVFEVDSASSPDPKITFASPSFLLMTGYTLEEVIGQNLAIFEGPSSDPAAIADIRRHIDAHAPYRSHIQHHRKGGQPYWVDFSLVPADRSNGESRYWVSVQHDITVMKRQQAALDAAEAERLSAQQEGDAKSRFLANMSHELRTPMNGVIGVAELLLETRLDADQQKYAHTVLSSAESLLSLLNDILDYSKIEAGELEIDRVPLDLLVLIEDVVDLLAVRARDREVDLLVHFPNDVPRSLIGDPLRLRQILFNLVGNAVKFTERGHVLISVGYGDDKIKISIKDTGIGVPEGSLRANFDNFNQIDASTTRKFGGTGLGLCISQSLVSLMGGGDIEVASRLGEGSTFSFEILAVLDKNAASPPFHKQPLQGCRILIVDDNALNRRIFKEMLETTGMTCVTVPSGPAALEAIGRSAVEGQLFDAVLLDFSMPMMNGEQTAMAIKAMPGMADLTIVMISAADETRDEVRLERANLSAWLTKPIRREQLGSLFGSLLEAKRLGNKESSAVDSKVLKGRPGSLVRRPDVVAKRQEAQSLQGLEVLLVEDNRINQKVAAERLKGLACKVTIAENGREAVEKVQVDIFDLILMDCQMPEMDGYEATQKIRQLSADGKIARLPIIALTANAMAGDREKCLSAGMDDYMAKPVRKENLMAALSTWAPSKRSAEPDERLPKPAANPSASLPKVSADTSTATIGASDPKSAIQIDKLATEAKAVRQQADDGRRGTAEPSQHDETGNGKVPGASASQESADLTTTSSNAEAMPPQSRPAQGSGSAYKATSSSPSQTEGSIDNNILDGIRESMGDQFGVILQYYLEDANDYVSQIERSGSHDIKAIVAPAHTLKSSSREIGALQVSEIAQQIEQLARQSSDANTDPVSIDRLIQDLTPAFKRAKTQLEQLLH